VRYPVGEDLLLLSIRPDQGRIATVPQIDYGLMGAELVRLVSAEAIQAGQQGIFGRVRWTRPCKPRSRLLLLPPAAPAQADTPSAP
jgi:hypothetical protein